MQNDLESKHLLQFELPEELAGRQFYIIYQKGYILKDYVEEFANYLLNFYQ